MIPALPAAALLPLPAAALTRAFDGHHGALAFGCILTGKNAAGKQARALVEELFAEQGWL